MSNNTQPKIMFPFCNRLKGEYTIAEGRTGTRRREVGGKEEGRKGRKGKEEGRKGRGKERKREGKEEGRKGRGKERKR